MNSCLLYVKFAHQILDAVTFDRVRVILPVLSLAVSYNVSEPRRSLVLPSTLQLLFVTLAWEATGKVRCWKLARVSHLHVTWLRSLGRSQLPNCPVADPCCLLYFVIKEHADPLMCSCFHTIGNAWYPLHRSLQHLVTSTSVSSYTLSYLHIKTLLLASFIKLCLKPKKILLWIE